MNKIYRWLIEKKTSSLIYQLLKFMMKIYAAIQGYHKPRATSFSLVALYSIRAKLSTVPKNVIRNK